MKKTAKKLIAMLLIIAMIVPTFGMMYSSAATGDTVELAFNNLFVMESWANNRLSSTVIPQGNGTLETDLEDGSFTLTKTSTTQGEVYTAFAMGTGDGATGAANNFNYYMAAVEPNTTYNFSYTLEGTVKVFTPFVFMYDTNGNYVNLVTGQTTTTGEKSFTFTTGKDIGYIQVRFTINETAESVYAKVSDVVISQIDTFYSSTNLFDFDSWAGSANSNDEAWDFGYDDGTITATQGTGVVNFETNTKAGNDSGMLFSRFSFSSNEGYYSIDVEPNTTYTLFYNIAENSTIGNFEPYIVRNNASGGFIDYIGLGGATHYGESSGTFTTTADTEYISVVFSITHGNQNWTATVGDIALYQTEVVDYRNDPHRLTYTEGTGTYGELPTPTTIPEGKVFAGWYTGKDGSGEAITADTEISYKSYTVYPYYQTKVDSLTIKTPPVKTTYTLGEKLNTTGLVLEATVGTSTFDITSGYTCSPTYLENSGTQAITVSYGGQSVIYNVDVSLFNEKTIPVNDTEVVAQVANNVYTINYTAPEAFSRYEITYYSDSYVKGTITMSDGTYEDFFLEPATNGSFASYIDDYLTGGTYSDIKSIGFECLDKEFGNFELYSVETVYVAPPADTMAYYVNDEYKAGINLAWGGVLAYLQDTKHNPVAATYSDGITKVNYSSQLPSGATATSDEVNLINTYDKGRYVQQSYYGTYEEPFVQGNYNGVDWNYNPIQGGNILGEASKVVDYRITDTEIYVKTRPLEWAKWSDEAGEAYNASQPDASKHKELIYEDSYNAWAYMESWYVFEDGMIKTYCRYVDYSGYPSATTTQEFPAFYCVEPLNNFVYYAGGEAWDDATNTVQWESDLDFWGASPEYNQMLIENGQSAVDPNFTCNENWAAFMGGTTNNDYGIGIYSADVTHFVAGSYQPKYQELSGQGLVPQVTSLRHADTTDPATEDPTSYIAPINTMELESYKEYTYAYYITTGTQEEIREDFRREADEDAIAEMAKTKIAVPETVYMTPATSPDATTTVGQYYVNNILDASDYYNVKTEADATAGMYFGVHSGDAVQYKISVTNATNSADDIILGNADGTGNNEGTWYDMNASGNDIKDNVYSLRFASAGLAPGETATAKWEITIQYEDGTTKTYTAFTVMYAPMTTVGAVAEARQTSTDMNEVSSWITGANGIDPSRTAPLGSFYGDYSNSGYFKYDPLAYPDVSVLTGISTGGTANDLINVATDSSGYYVQQTATNGADDSRSHSYLGLLAIDKSRYSNTNQIPNLNIGYDALRVGSNEEDSLDSYATYYTLGTSESYTATDLGEAPSGWTVNSSYNELYSNNGGVIPYRETVVPSYAVSDDLDGKYIHAVVQGRAVQQAGIVLGSNYATAGTSVLLSVTDKSALRDAVTDGYTLPEENYSDDSYSQFEKELEDAATVLGDPSVSQDEIDQAQKELEDAKDELVNNYYALKYDNLFSAYEYSQKLGSMTMNVTSNASIGYTAGTLTVISDNAEKSDVYAKEGSTSNYYNIDVKPSTEYVFEYDVTTVAGSQVLLFFYDANGNQVASTNQTMQIGSGNPSNITSTPHLAAYVTTDGHVVLKFTTNANVDRIGIRFGNTNNVVNESTFTNIRFIEAEKYYADAQYSRTESVYKEYDTYGTLITPVRPGYTFTGWVYEDGTAATAADLATAHKSVYSTWKINDYTITYNANGGTVSSTSKGYNVEDALVLDTPTRENYIFKGWEVTATDGNWTVGTVYQPDAIPEGMYGNVTLTAVWEELTPTAFEDSVVIDYGLPVRIHVCVNDQNLDGGTLTAIGTKLVEGAKIGANAYDETQLVDGVTTGLVLPNGTASIDGDTIVYTPSNTSMSSENTFYYEYKAADGKYYYTTVTVIPATNIYYEESFMKFENGDGYVWTEPEDKVSITGRFQSEDRPGESNNVYGSDSAYNDSYTYSLGNAKYTTIDNASFGKEPTASFTFSGTGFDLFSVTNNDTGAVTVQVYNADNGELVDYLFADTYYGYKVDDAGTLLPDTESTNGMYQVPIISYTALDADKNPVYGTYDVLITPIYSSAFDPNYVKGAEDSTNAYSIYIDSVRIFNPAGIGDDIKSDVVADAYFQDGEFAPMYMEVRNTILSAKEYYSDEIQNLGMGYKGSIFLDGNIENGIDETGIKTYATQGPNNEVYLGKNQAVAFKLTTEDIHALASLQLGMKVASGDTAEVIVMNTNEKNPETITISGAHQQFKNMDSDIMVWNQVEVTENGVTKTVYQTAYPIVVVNTSDTVISLTTFKWAYSTADAGEEVVSFSVDRSTGEQASYAVRRVMNNGSNTITDENISISWSDTTFTEGKEATLTVTTPADVVKVTIDGIEITDYTIDNDGNKVWTYTFVVKQSGDTEYEILFYDRNGLVDEVVKTETITVEKAPAGSDVVTPDEPGADTTESIFEIILNFFKKILSFFGGVFG